LRKNIARDHPALTSPFAAGFGTTINASQFTKVSTSASQPEDWVPQLGQQCGSGQKVSGFQHTAKLQVNALLGNDAISLAFTWADTALYAFSNTSVVACPGSGVQLVSVVATFKEATPIEWTTSAWLAPLGNSYSCALPLVLVATDNSTLAVSNIQAQAFMASANFSAGAWWLRLHARARSPHCFVMKTARVWEGGSSECKMQGHAG
jgi:hypothetical protein